MALDKQKITFISLSVVLLIAAIIMGVMLMDSRKQNEELANTFRKLEKIWEEYDVYEKVQE